MNTSNVSSSPNRTDAARRAQLLAEFDRSGLSAAAFARQQQLKYTTFCNWRQQRDKVRRAPALVPVELASEPSSGGLVIELGPVARLRVEGSGQIGLAAELLRQLNTPGS